ncbi:MAG TPA: ATP-grasp domain-containing protein [Actinomycetes bacterium]|nr:ATP-grasp domain-containing protein [Actinomycetes bacterium]
MNDQWLVLVESNTTGSGRLFCASARRLGLRPVLLARDPARYPYLATDDIDAVAVDTASVAAVCAAAGRLGGRVAGVTSSSEYFIGTASEAARTLGRPHPDPDAVRACRNKHIQRLRLAAAGVPGPAFAAAGTPAAAVRAAERIGYPVVVKPVAGSGSIGTRLCGSAAEVHEAAAGVLAADPAAIGLPPQEAVMVEAKLDGAEFSVETLDDQVIGVIGKRLGPEPYFVEIGHDFPAPVDRAARAALERTAIDALRALGLGWGAAHVELRHTEAAGARLIEVNPRLAGGMIPRMIEESRGVDMIFHMVAKAAGRARSPRPTRSRAAAIRFLVAPHAGQLVEIAGVAAARRVPGVVEVGLTCRPGQELVLGHSFRDRLGYVIAAAEAGNVAARAADDGLRALEARIAPASVVAEGSPH